MGMFAGRSVQQAKVTHARLMAWGLGKLRLGISARLYRGLSHRGSKASVESLGTDKGCALGVTTDRSKTEQMLREEVDRWNNEV
jgi:hypothetical protein